jgi:hypothetical protein
VFARVREGARLARRGLDLPPSAADDWSLDVNGLRCVHPGLVFREGDRLSFSLFVGVPVERAKIVERFRQKVEGAVRNLQDHCDTGPDRTNVLLYRIPHLLPIDDAAAAVLSVLETNTSTSTASVFLYRALFSTVHEQRASYYLGHELREVVNARAAVAASAVVPGGTFALQVLGGKPQHVEPVQMVSDGEKSFPVADMWMRLHGRHYLRRPDWRGGDLEIIRPHGVAIWFANGHAISGGIAEKQLTEAIPDEVSLL